MASWAAVWEAKGALPLPADGDPRRVALAMNGYDGPTAGGVTPKAFDALVRDWATVIDLQAEDSVHEVGCGAGAFLASVRANTRAGALSGNDLSRSLVTAGQALFPAISFEHAEASELSVTPAVDHLVSFGVFMYFADLAYADEVISRMQQRAVRSVSILDVPDLDRKTACEAARRAAHHGDYERIFDGLSHQYYTREWLRTRFDDDWDVILEDQRIEGYAMAPFRFSLVARRRPPAPQAGLRT